MTSGYICSFLLHFNRRLTPSFNSGEDPRKVSCIVFVERVIAAVVISNLLQHIDCLKCLKTDFLSSVSSTFGSKTQQKALENFSSGKVGWIFHSLKTVTTMLFKLK